MNKLSILNYFLAHLIIALIAYGVSLFVMLFLIYLIAIG